MNGKQNLKEVVIEQFYEVCLSFQDDPYEVNKETIDIGHPHIKTNRYQPMFNRYFKPMFNRCLTDI